MSRKWTTARMPKRSITVALIVLPAVAFATDGIFGVAQAQTVVPFEVNEGEIAKPLANLKGNAERGKLIVFDPERGNCTICHPVSGRDARTQGDVGPPLAGVGTRLSEGQIRLRVVDGTRINPDTIMPPYYRVSNLNRVAREWIGKPVLGAQEIEDVVAFLATLKD